MAGPRSERLRHVPGFWRRTVGQAYRAAAASPPAPGAPGVFVAAVAILALAGAWRLAQDPSFWLDEAYIADSLRTRGPWSLYGPLLYDQWFPRSYLVVIHWVQGGLGYSTLALRLVPFTCYLLASALMAHVLYRRVRHSLVLSLLAAALLVSADQWLLQAASLKQYTFDTLMALLPFVLPERCYHGLLRGRSGPAAALLLAFPAAVSYPYVVSLSGRLIGAFLLGPRGAGAQSRRPHLRGLLWVVGLTGIALGTLFITDLRFNRRGPLEEFWSTCILRDLVDEPVAFAAVLARLLFAWYRHTLPLLFSAVFAVLWVLGAAAALAGLSGAATQARGRDGAPADSVPLGSLASLLAAVAASLAAGYPLCRGRLTLFLLVHVQLLMLVGARLLWRWTQGWRPGRLLLGVLSTVALAFGLMAAVATARRPAPEDLRRVLPRIEQRAAEPARPVFLHDCTATQWRTLPERVDLESRLQVAVLDGGPGDNLERLRQAGEVWVVWTHRVGPCGERLEAIRRAAQVWEVVYDESEASLVRARF